MASVFLNEWKRASGIRLWRDFWQKEYAAKYERLRVTCNEIAREAGYESEPHISTTAEGLQTTLIVGLTVDGENVASFRTFKFKPDSTALVHDFESEADKVFKAFREFVEGYKTALCKSPHYRSGFGAVA